MKKIILFIVIISFTSVFAQYSGTGSNTKTTKVKTYTKKDGTVVKEHKRTKTNEYNLDNYKAKNNYNPHTGKVGKTEYKTPYNSLHKSNNKSFYKSEYKVKIPKVKTPKTFKTNSYKPKKIKFK